MIKFSMMKDVYPVCAVGLVAVLSSCTQVSNEVTDAQVKVASFVEFQGDYRKAVKILPSIVARSGEKAEVEIDPSMLEDSSHAIQGCRLTVKSDVVTGGVRSKGTFSVFHYNGSKAPEVQNVAKFDFVSKSGSEVRIPFKYGHPREFTYWIGAGDDRKVFKGVERPVDATFVIKALEIDVKSDFPER